MHSVAQVIVLGSLKIKIPKNKMFVLGISHRYWDCEGSPRHGYLCRTLNWEKKYLYSYKPMIRSALINKKRQKELLCYLTREELLFFDSLRERSRDEELSQIQHIFSEFWEKNNIKQRKQARLLREIAKKRRTYTSRRKKANQWLKLLTNRVKTRPYRFHSQKELLLYPSEKELDTFKQQNKENSATVDRNWRWLQQGYICKLGEQTSSSGFVIEYTYTFVLFPRSAVKNRATQEKIFCFLTDEECLDFITTAEKTSDYEMLEFLDRFNAQILRQDQNYFDLRLLKRRLRKIKQIRDVALKQGKYAYERKRAKQWLNKIKKRVSRFPYPRRENDEFIQFELYPQDIVIATYLKKIQHAVFMKKYN